MLTQDPFPFSPLQVAEFHAHQARRIALLRGMGDRIGLWRHCPKPACRRRKACTRDDAACFRSGIRALMTDEDRALGHAAVKLMAAGMPRDEALAEAQRRLAARAAERDS